MRLQPEMPDLEIGYPMPAPKHADMRRKARPSPFFALLQRMRPAFDSFVVDWPKLATVKRVAQHMGVSIVWQDAGRPENKTYRQARVWRLT